MTNEIRTEIWQWRPASGKRGEPGTGILKPGGPVRRRLQNKDILYLCDYPIHSVTGKEVEYLKLLRQKMQARVEKLQPVRLPPPPGAEGVLTSSIERVLRPKVEKRGIIRYRKGCSENHCL